MTSRRWGSRALGVAFTALALLAGCSSTRPDPTPLKAYTPAFAARQVWSLRTEEVRFPLIPVVKGDEVIVAASSGIVRGVSLDRGEVKWSLDLKSPLSAAVGSGDQRLAVVTRDTNHLVVVQQGRELWRSPLVGRVMTPPLLAGERVFVLSTDRTVRAFDAASGQGLWTFKRPGDPLALLQTGVLVPYQDTLLVGQGARLLGLDPLNGKIRWDVAMASPRGTNEVERLADLVGPVVRDGSVFCLRSFQNTVGCVDAQTTRVQWTASSTGGQPIAADAELLFSTDDMDRLHAHRRRNGALAWSVDTLLYRTLSAPARWRDAVVVGDGEGILHVLARDDGRTLLRLNTDGSPVIAVRVAPNDTLLAVTRRGGVFAYRVNAS
jgi:outer membrane protein assembly factor BamB